MAIPASFIQELIARADVVDIVGRYVQLKKGGANFMGLCPFHGEKSPSFSVSPAKQFYHCFGCGKNGNAISFLMDHVGMTFVEAVKDLAQQYGMQVPEEEGSPQDRARAAEQRQKQATLTDVLEKACDAYKKNLKNTPKAVDYFKGRGLSGEIAKQFGLGYAPEGWRSLASVFPNYDDPLLVESGLVIASNEPGEEDKRYDRFRDRMMFPIRNVKGECIGFGGRVLGEGTPKYLNSPETPVFSKGRELYGLFEARTALREQGYVLVTEGYMDVVALAQLGFPNAVATLGTACTPDHVQKLFRFTDSVVFSFDGDAAGRRAARKALDGAIPYATDVRTVKFLFLPKEHDPDSFIREFGKEAFSRYVSEATPLTRFLIDSAREGCDLNTIEGRSHFASNANPLWTPLPEGALKRQLLGEIADLVQLNTRELQEVWEGSTQARQPAAKAYSPGSRDGTTAASDKKYSKNYDSNYKNKSDSGNKYAGSDSFSPSKPSYPTSYAAKARGGFTPDRPTGRIMGRAKPASRADHAARLLLSNTALWEQLSHDDHAMLCEQPEPHSDLFIWLEAQLHDHGALPWGALREGLREHALEAVALKLMSEAQPKNEPEAHEAMRESQQELRALLNRMHIERLKVLETEAIEAAKADPSALQRYRELQLRRQKLEATHAPLA
ncbi:MAG: DNA primase [Burkholderiaceae bacterium]|nr:DNA primase [Burkholderiaceae bacterium]